MAISPIDYSGMQVTADPAQALLSGVKTGFGLNQIAAQKQQLELQQKQQLQQQQDAQALASNPNASASDYAAYALKYPSLTKQTKDTFDLLSTDQQQQRLNLGAQVYGALNSNRPDLAESLLQDRVKALQNGGNPADLDATKRLLQVVQADPGTAKNLAGVTLAAWMGPDKFSAAFPAIGKEQREQAAAAGERDKTTAETANLRSKVDTRAAQLDIQREENRIKAMEASLKREDNDLRRQELQRKIDDAKLKRDQLQRENQSSADSAFSTVDRALDTVSKLQAHPGLAGNLGARGVIPNVPGTEAADARALIDQLQSQGFLAEVDKMRGMGALTEAEGKKLTNAIGALDTKQSESQFRKQLDSINSQFTEARKRIGQKYGVTEPTRQEPTILVSPKFGNVTQKMIDDLAKKKGVSVDQVEQFFREAR